MARIAAEDVPESLSAVSRKVTLAPSELTASGVIALSAEFELPVDASVTCAPLAVAETVKSSEAFLRPSTTLDTCTRDRRSANAMPCWVVTVPESCGFTKVLENVVGASTDAMSAPTRPKPVSWFDTQLTLVLPHAGAVSVHGCAQSEPGMTLDSRLIDLSEDQVKPSPWLLDSPSIATIDQPDVICVPFCVSTMSLRVIVPPHVGFCGSYGAW